MASTLADAEHAGAAEFADLSGAESGTPEVPVKPLTSLAIAVLALLFERPMHPYEMYQLSIQRHDDRIVKVRPGSLYHTVERLASQSLVRAVGTDREGNRPERTTYEVTARGRAALIEQVRRTLACPVREYPVFAVALAEAHNLPAAEAAAALRQRIARLEDELAVLDARLAYVAEIQLPRPFWLESDYAAAQLRAQIEWLTEATSEIEEGTLAWIGPTWKSHPACPGSLPGDLQTHSER